MFAVGLMDCDAFTQSEEDRHRGREEEKNETQERESEDDGSSSRRHSIDMSKGRPDGIPPEGGPADRSLNALGKQRARCLSYGTAQPKMCPNTLTI